MTEADSNPFEVRVGSRCKQIFVKEANVEYFASPHFLVEPMDLGAGLGAGLGHGSVRGERFHVIGNLKIWLSGSRLEEPESGTAGWLSKTFGLFHQQVESLSVSEFVTKLTDFFAAANLNSVLLVEIDGNRVYSGEGNADERAPNLSLAADRTRIYLRSRNREHNRVIFSVVGQGHELHLFVEAQFSKRHAFGKKTFEINATGVPSEFMKSVSLVDLDSWRKMKEINIPIDSSEGVQYVQRMAAVMDEYASKIGLTFSVEKTKIGDIAKRGIPSH